jgi:type I restriction enzyme S subunit
LSGAVSEKEISASRTYITEAGLQNSSAKVFPPDTVLVAMYGATAGQVGILRISAATNQAVCGIYPDENYLPDFLYYYLQNYKERLLLETSGVAQPNLSQAKIRDVRIPVLSLEEQERIVAKLDAVFAEAESAQSAIRLTRANYGALKSAILAQELQGEAA